MQIITPTLIHIDILVAITLSSQLNIAVCMPIAAWYDYDIIYRQKFMVMMQLPNHGHSRMSWFGNYDADMVSMRTPTLLTVV